MYDLHQAYRTFLVRVMPYISYFRHTEYVR